MRYYSEKSGRRGQADSATDNLDRGLGWFSIALGLAEVAAPRKLTKALGMEGHEQLVFAYGVREIMTGIGILASRDPTPWIWGRVGRRRARRRDADCRPCRKTIRSGAM